MSLAGGGGFTGPRTLGRSGLVAGRLGVAGGYGVPAEALELAFERGCTYFYHGSRRRPGMTRAIRSLCGRGLRDRLVVVAQSYSRSAWYLRRSLTSFLRESGLDHADVLLLGWHNRPPSERILATCAALKERGLFRHLALSGHRRPLFADLAGDRTYDLFHLRYNAGHRGAEEEVFAKLPPLTERPGIVTYTATCWGKLLKPAGLPREFPVPRASDCYRFVLTNPAVDVCLCGPRSRTEMEEALAALERGPLSEDELAWMRRMGDRVAGRK